ncbi:Pol polyprotein [Plakobranchus ocellatus]|uniref:Pol polyprotein n=1 Tax=Plakobranchus ocellatus TaxID=259542 RepID=A0AAV4CW27_9GAST|nr:Pol polyprotein [Plakobranchus ocellatus]
MKKSCPMERVHLDFLGPLSRTKARNEHVLKIVDQCTKWVECLSLPLQTAEVTASAAVRELFSRFGCPFQIFTDQGQNFESNLFKSVCESLNINKSRTAPYHPSSNRKLERYNKTLLNAMQCYLQGRQDRWDEYVPFIAAALRASLNRNTGFTPNRLMLGREVTTPLELIFLLPREATEGPSMDPYVSLLEQDLRQAYAQARETLKTIQKRMKGDYDLKALRFHYEVGDAVYVCEKASLNGRCDKIKSAWKGPGLVI